MGIDIATVTAASGPEQKELAAQLAATVKAEGALSLKDSYEAFKATLLDTNKKTSGARAGALALYASLCETAFPTVEPFMVKLLDCVLACTADKDKNVRTAADEAGKALMKKISPFGVKSVLPLLLKSMNPSGKWQTILAAVVLLDEMAQTCPTQVALELPLIVPVLTVCMADSKKDVKDAATKAMNMACAAIDNRDIEPMIPAIITSITNLAAVTECVNKLASTTFVQTVDGSALSIVVPVLVCGFREKAGAVQRQSAVIVNNMSKLVEDVAEAEPFLPQLIPSLEKAADEVSDPEARSVCAKALAQLNKIKSQITTANSSKADPAVYSEIIASKLKGASDEFAKESVAYAACLAASMSDSKTATASDYESIAVYLTTFAKDTGAAVKAVKEQAEKEASARVVKEVEEVDDAEELCNCKFTLAYGSKILLHNTQMQLKRGYRYGLLGGNDSGKTTLMRAIANEQVEGFPPASELRTVFVEADIQGEMSHLSCIDYIFMDERIEKLGCTKEEVTSVLATVGFTEEGKARPHDPVTSLSGGWRMKLALARAMLQHADILLLDEPTNHLDVINVAWVQDYLKSLTNVTSIIVSHDSKLLDNVCTHMLQIEDLKLHMFKGNLSAFVAIKPEAAAYFELKSSKLKFKFPQPGFIEGIKSKGKPLMKMDKCSFTYPGNTKPTITDITVRVSLSSRVACVGVNGAGKSTMIKLLTGELIPQVGDVWKHPNARVAYVAQHAFHHIENHLTKTPNEYIRWRYEFGDDKEGLEKVTMKLTEEEEERLRQPVQVDIENKDGTVSKVKMSIERLTGYRRTNKRKEFEYECAFMGKSPDCNTYISLEKLGKMGFDKHCKAVDEKVAARANAQNRPVTKDNVEKHLEDVGLDREFGTHHRMSALSGGQKVKVVLAAAMWNQPHIIILDEPTNYLDRESLGALADAIREYEGGVVMITHNNQFCSALCPETWVLEHGTLDCKGDPEWMKMAMNEKTEFKALDTMIDAMGNTVEVKQKKQLSAKDKKKKQKLKAAARKRGETVSDSEDEEWAGFGDE